MSPPRPQLYDLIMFGRCFSVCRTIFLLLFETHKFFQLIEFPVRVNLRAIPPFLRAYDSICVYKIFAETLISMFQIV